MVETRARMEMAYRGRWKAELAEMQRVLAGFAMKEECKWGKPTYTMDGKNIVILQAFREYFALGFFQGALLKDRKKVLVQLGQTHAGRVMKFTSVKDITAKAATIKAYVREAIAIEKAGLRMKPKRTSDFPVPEELSERFRRDPRFKRAFEALTPGRQRSYLYHFCGSQTVGDQGGANRQGDAGDIRGQRIPGERGDYGEADLPKPLTRLGRTI